MVKKGFLGGNPGDARCKNPPANAEDARDTGSTWLKWLSMHTLMYGG